uniref:Uncharacterized protein n=1 Tax=Panagrolaimus sp. PS1159 TaxID=55785 RepID=A0AC35FW02_9BILA
MTEYGFPIFYKYHWKDDKLNVDFIIANGKQAPNKQGETRPKSEKETLSGALYLNQRFAKYAYFIYQSASSSTCIFTIDFEDLFQGDLRTSEYGTIKPKEINRIPKIIKNFYYPFFTIDPIFGTMVYLFQGDLRTLAYGTIKPKEINRIPKIIENFYYPFFTIDPIFGTMVYLVRDGNELSAVHYIINENRIKYFEQVFPLELRADPNNPTEIVWYLANPDIMFERGVLPVFTSYGKSTFFFLPKSGEGGGTSAFGFWTASKVQESYVKVLHYDNHRHFYYLNYGYFENGEPFGKYVESSECFNFKYF